MKAGWKAVAEGLAVSACLIATATLGGCLGTAPGGPVAEPSDVPDSAKASLTKAFTLSVSAVKGTNPLGNRPIDPINENCIRATDIALPHVESARLVVTGEGAAAGPREWLAAYWIQEREARGEVRGPLPLTLDLGFSGFDSGDGNLTPVLFFVLPYGDPATASALHRLRAELIFAFRSGHAPIVDELLASCG